MNNIYAKTVREEYSTPHELHRFEVFKRISSLIIKRIGNI